MTLRDPFEWDDEAPEPDIDVCVACGRYFAWTDHQAELARQRYPNRPFEQQCIPCLRGDPPPHEY